MSNIEENSINNNDITESENSNEKKKDINNKKQKKEYSEFEKILFKNRKRGYIKEVIFTIIPLIFIMIFIRTLLIDSYTVPSESMHSTLVPGDKLIALKSIYGIRFPLINESINGFTNPKKGNIIIFEHPEYEPLNIYWEFFNLMTLGITRVDNNQSNVRTVVKRCMATPGDTIRVDQNKNVYVNGEKLPKELYEETTYTKYGIDTKIKAYKEKNGNKSYIIQQEISNFSQATPLYYIPKKGDLMIIEKINDENDLFELSSGEFKITIDGHELSRDVINKYSQIIEDEIGKKLHDIKENKTEYIIKNGYYFGMGDNRDNSRDSRSWGLIRDDLIYGTPLFIFFPFNRIGIVK